MKKYALITTLILTIIHMSIEPIKFLDKELFKIKYDANNRIYGNCSNLDWHDNHKEKTVKKIINKDNKKKIQNEN